MHAGILRHFPIFRNAPPFLHGIFTLFSFVDEGSSVTIPAMYLFLFFFHMNAKKTLLVSVIGILAVASAAFAETGDTASGSTGSTSTGTSSTGTSSTGVTSTGTSSTGTATQTGKIACVAPYVTTRETAVGAAVDKEYAAIKAALDARKAALATAWSSSANAKTLRAAVNTAWKNYSKAVKAAHFTAAKERRAAWKSFKTDVRACKAPGAVNGIENAGEGADASETR
jgi:hypothetical protein